MKTGSDSGPVRVKGLNFKNLDAEKTGWLVRPQLVGRPVTFVPTGHREQELNHSTPSKPNPPPKPQLEVSEIRRYLIRVLVMRESYNLEVYTRGPLLSQTPR